MKKFDESLSNSRIRSPIKRCTRWFDLLSDELSVWANDIVAKID